MRTDKRNQMNANIPDNFLYICEAVHPLSGISGSLVRSRATGVYSLQVRDGDKPPRYTSIPHRFAQELAASVGKPSDVIQDLCIKRMNELSLSPESVADMLPHISGSHIIAFLTRRASMNTNKLSRLLPVLDLRIAEMERES